MNIVANSTKPQTNNDYFKDLAQLPSRPLRDRPCGGCAITTGFYTEYADRLLEENEDLQNRVMESWFCHNCNKACRGLYNYIHVMRKKGDY